MLELQFATRLSSERGRQRDREGEGGWTGGRGDRQTVLMGDWTNSICIHAVAFIFCVIIEKKESFTNLTTETPLK